MLSEFRPVISMWLFPIFECHSKVAKSVGLILAHESNTYLKTDHTITIFSRKISRKSHLLSSDLLFSDFIFISVNDYFFTICFLLQWALAFTPRANFDFSFFSLFIQIKFKFVINKIKIIVVIKKSSGYACNQMSCYKFFNFV